MRKKNIRKEPNIIRLCRNYIKLHWQLKETKNHKESQRKCLQ